MDYRVPNWREIEVEFAAKKSVPANVKVKREVNYTNLNSLSAFSLITMADFDHLVTSEEDSVVLFYWIHCPYCIEFLPTYQKLADGFHEANSVKQKVVFTMIDSSIEPDDYSIRYALEARAPGISAPVPKMLFLKTRENKRMGQIYDLPTRSFEDVATFAIKYFGITGGLLASSFKLGRSVSSVAGLSTIQDILVIEPKFNNHPAGKVKIEGGEGIFPNPPQNFTKAQSVLVVPQITSAIIKKVSSMTPENGLIAKTFKPRVLKDGVITSILMDLGDQARMSDGTEQKVTSGYFQFALYNFTLDKSVHNAVLPCLVFAIQSGMIPLKDIPMLYDIDGLQIYNPSTQDMIMHYISRLTPEQKRVIILACGGTRAATSKQDKERFKSQLDKKNDIFTEYKLISPRSQSSSHSLKSNEISSQESNSDTRLFTSLTKMKNIYLEFLVYCQDDGEIYVKLPPYKLLSNNTTFYPHPVCKINSDELDNFLAASAKPIYTDNKKKTRSRGAFNDNFRNRICNARRAVFQPSDRFIEQILTQKVAGHEWYQTPRSVLEQMMDISYSDAKDYIIDLLRPQESKPSLIETSFSVEELAEPETSESPLIVLKMPYEYYPQNQIEKIKRRSLEDAKDAIEKDLERKKSMVLLSLHYSPPHDALKYTPDETFTQRFYDNDLDALMVCEDPDYIFFYTSQYKYFDHFGVPTRAMKTDEEGVMDATHFLIRHPWILKRGIAIDTSRDKMDREDIPISIYDLRDKRFYPYRDMMLFFEKKTRELEKRK